MSARQSFSSTARHELLVSSLAISVFVSFLVVAPGTIATANLAFCLKRVCQTSLTFLVLIVPLLSFSCLSITASLSGGLPVSACLAWLLALTCLANGFSSARSESGRLGIADGLSPAVRFDFVDVVCFCINLRFHLRFGLAAPVSGGAVNSFPVQIGRRDCHGLA